MSNHTPGPWFISGVRIKATIGGMRGHWHGIGRYDEEKKKDDMFALVDFDPKTGLGWADAKLISAAPDLFSALKAILRHGEIACVDANGQRITSYSGGKKPASKDVFQFPRHLLRDIDEAISKAEGTTPKGERI